MSSTPDATVCRAAEIALFLVRKERSEVLLVHRIPRLGGFWHVIAGGVDPGETWRDAAERELREETALDFQRVACCGSASFTYTVDPASGPDPQGVRRSERVSVRCVLAEVQDEWSPSLNWEHDDYVWCRPEKAVERLHWSNIAAALTETLSLQL